MLSVITIPVPLDGTCSASSGMIPVRCGILAGVKAPNGTRQPGAPLGAQMALTDYAGIGGWLKQISADIV